MKRFIPFCLMLMVMLGCLGSQQTTQNPTEEAEAPQALAEIRLSTPKTSYTAKEAVSARNQHPEREIRHSCAVCYRRD